MHARTQIINAVETALKTAFTVIQATDAVQETDVPCVVMEEREENNGEFDTILQRPATALRRRFRFAIFCFGKTKLERDTVSQTVEMLVAPAVFAIVPAVGEVGFKAALVGVGFSKSRLGTSMAAFVAGQFYDAEYMTPTYL